MCSSRAGWTSECGPGLGAPAVFLSSHPAHPSRAAFTLAVKEGAPPWARHRSPWPALPWGLLDRHLSGLSCIFFQAAGTFVSPHAPTRVSRERGPSCSVFTSYADLSATPSHSVQSPRRPRKGSHCPLTPVLLPAAAPPSRGQLSSSLVVLGGVLTTELPTCRPPPDPDQDPLF